MENYQNGWEGGTMSEKLIKRRTVKAFKREYGMDEVSDEEFIEWWRRNHGTGYKVKIVDDGKDGS